MVPNAAPVPCLLGHPGVFEGPGFDLGGGVTLFLVCPPGGSIQQGQRDMQYVQMMKSKWRLKMGVKHNSTRQKHFRAQVIF